MIYFILLLSGAAMGIFFSALGKASKLGDEEYAMFLMQGLREQIKEQQETINKLIEEKNNDKN